MFGISVCCVIRYTTLDARTNEDSHRNRSEGGVETRLSSSFSLLSLLFASIMIVYYYYDASSLQL